MNKEQLQFFYDEIMGLFGWDDGDEASGVDPLLWVRKQLFLIRDEVKTWKVAEKMALETVAQLRASLALSELATEEQIKRNSALLQQLAQLEADNEIFKKSYYDIADAIAPESSSTKMLIDRVRAIRNENDGIRESFLGVCGRYYALRAELDKMTAVVEHQQQYYDAQLAANDAALEEARNLLAASVPWVEQWVGHFSPARGLPEEITAWLSAHPAPQEEK